MQLVKLNKRPLCSGCKFTYVLRYSENGKRRFKTLGHTNLRKAEKQRAQKEKELRMGYVEPCRIRLSKLLENYLEQTRTQIEKSTADSAAYRMRDLINAIGNKYADEVTYNDCERFQQHCIDRGLSPATVNTHIKMVKRIFSLAVKRGLIEENPFLGLPLLKVPRKHVRLFNANEFDRIMRAARTQIWKARILLAKTAGLRRGEILNLTIGDIDFANKKIFVQPKKETSQTWRWVVKDKDRREVPLTDEAAQLLVDIHAELPEGQPYLLLSPERYQHLLKLKAKGLLIDRVRKCPDGNCRRNWQMICKRAGISDGTFHDLRATCITEWLENAEYLIRLINLNSHLFSWS